LEKISEENGQQDLEDALTFGNHKGVLIQPVLLKKLISKYVIHGNCLPTPVECQINSRVSNGTHEHYAVKYNQLIGQIIPKDQLTHDQSWQWSSGTSVNSRTKKELLQSCHFGFCIHRIVNWAVATRSFYPNKRILATKIDYKLTYRQGHLHWLAALQMCTQLPDNNLAIIRLRLRGAPCPFKWGVISEPICDLANELI
jgi:hypothetical protein